MAWWRSILFAVGIGIAWTGCHKRSTTLVFVIPDGYAGIIKIRPHKDTGAELHVSGGQCKLIFSQDGICDIKGRLPTLRWHRSVAQYASGKNIYCPEFPETAPEENFGLWPLGLKDNVESWYLVGKGNERKKALDQKYGFDVPIR